MDLPEIESKPAISCTFTPDSVFKVYINQSSGILDDSMYYEQDAHVVILENDLPFDTLNYLNAGWYYSSKKPVVGMKYDIKVNIPGKPECSSSDYIPAKTMISNALFQDSALMDENGYHASLSVSFADNADEKNFYELFLIHHSLSDSGEFQNNLIGCSCDKITDNVLKSEGLLAYWPTTFVFSDALINGMSYTMKLYFWRTSQLDHSDIIIVLRSISEDMYQYKKKLILHLNNQQSDLWNGTGEPVQMFSNITNGYGIFAGYTFDTNMISLP